MILNDIIQVLEKWAPPAYQESYDNSGLLVGSGNEEITKAIICLDCTEAVIDEAIDKGANLIIAHHPIVFSGLKKLNGKNYVERVVIKAIRHNIAIYAIHTNIDNIHTGVNRMIAEKLGIVKTRILSPKADVLYKLVTYAPLNKTDVVLQALFTAGAGHIGAYADCSFINTGIGSFKGDDTTNPYVGERGKRHYEEENRIEVIVPVHTKNKVIQALLAAHPYEEVAYNFFKIENAHTQVGSGMVGQLQKPMAAQEFLHHIKNSLNTACIRYTELVKDEIKTVALCGGSGSFLLADAIGAGADIFISADFTYHKFFDTEGKIIIADIGHFESEQFTIDLIALYLNEKLPTFATLKTSVSTNPIAYL